MKVVEELVALRSISQRFMLVTYPEEKEATLSNGAAAAEESDEEDDGAHEDEEAEGHVQAATGVCGFTQGDGRDHQDDQAEHLVAGLALI